MSPFALVLCALAQLPDGGPSWAQLAVQQTRGDEWVQQLLDDGRHVRFGTDTQGPVHVWVPKRYRPATADTVVYLHGFYTSVDQALLEHRLTEQFADSARNALFVVPETRSWRSDKLWWEDLEALLVQVEKKAKVERPKGGVTVVGHSGAYRNVVPWLQHPALTRVVLVDGLYGNEDELLAWVDGATERGRQLVLVGVETQQRQDWLTKKRGVTVVDGLPPLFVPLTLAQRSASILAFVGERFDHMSLVTSGRLLPWLLSGLR